MCPDSIFPFASQTMFPKKTDETTGHLRLRLFGIWPTKGLGSNYAIRLQGYNSCWGPELPKQHTGKAALHVHKWWEHSHQSLQLVLQSCPRNADPSSGSADCGQQFLVSPVWRLWKLTRHGAPLLRAVAKPACDGKDQRCRDTWGSEMECRIDVRKPQPFHHSSEVTLAFPPPSGWNVALQSAFSPQATQPSQHFGEALNSHCSKLDFWRCRTFVRQRWHCALSVAICSGHAKPSLCRSTSCSAPAAIAQWSKLLKAKDFGAAVGWLNGTCAGSVWCFPVKAAKPFQDLRNGLTIGAACMVHGMC